MDISTSSTPHYDGLTGSSSEFQSDAYLEYRSRVLAQLAEEKKLEASQNNSKQNVTLENTSLLHSSSHSGYEDNDSQDYISTDKSLFDSQPSWDDSDINYDGTDKYHWEDGQTLVPDKKHATTDSYHTFEKPHVDTTNLPITWNSVNEHISKNAVGASNSSDALSLDLDFSNRTSSQRLKRRSCKRNSLKRKKYEKERCNVYDEADFLNEKPYYASRPERSYSGGNQSLQICYINQSCSSDDGQSDGEQKGISTVVVSPTSSPKMALPRYGSRFLFQQRLSDSSLSSLSSSGFPSSQSSIVIPENTIIMYHNSHQQESKLSRTKQEELEMEARYQLAQAHKQAKIKAEELKKQKSLQENDSITLQLLKATLSDSISYKLNNFSLTNEDCMQLRLSHLKLILNEMQTTKSELNNELVSLLLLRDELKTEQDGKLVEVEDVKSIIVSVGPETTV